jgi:branched-chain amino acid transport system substrate-binding protein
MAEKGTVSRREFLRLAGIAGASIGAAAGLGGLVAACGEEETTTTAGATTTGGVTTTAGATTTTAGATTTVSAGVETGREIKVGIPAPKTGPFATFMIPFDWVLDQWTEILADGVVCGDGMNHMIKMSFQDTQSDSNRTAQVTGDLIQNEGVDVIFAGGSPETMNPAGDTCEALETPGLFCQGPWQAFYFGRGGTPDNNPFKWTYALCVGIEAMAQCFTDMWDQIPTNKKVGCIFSNSTDGQAWGNEENGGPFFFALAGYDYTMPTFYQPGTEDYTSQISDFKKFGAEICSGAMNSTDFTNFWKQCLQQGFNPKMCTVGLALTFAQTCEAIGPSAYGLTTELAWHADYPFTSSFTGQTCREIADAYEADTGNQWVSGTEIYSLMEVYVHVLKQVANVDDKAAIAQAMSTAKVDTMYGPVDFTMPVDPTADTPVTHPVPNCLRMPQSAAQWREGTKWPFEQFMVSDRYLPGATAVTPVEEMQYS